MDEPLHVQVARALGWTDLHPEPASEKWWGVEPYGGLRIAVPRYDTSWCSVGPLVERMKITVFSAPNSWLAFMGYDGGWVDLSSIDIEPNFAQEGKTPCEAVAKLIVTLKKEGKLPND